MDDTTAPSTTADDGILLQQQTSPNPEELSFANTTVATSTAPAAGNVTITTANNNNGSVPMDDDAIASAVNEAAEAVAEEAAKMTTPSTEDSSSANNTTKQETTAMTTDEAMPQTIPTEAGVTAAAIVDHVTAVVPPTAVAAATEQGVTTEPKTEAAPMMQLEQPSATASIPMVAAATAPSPLSPPALNDNALVVDETKEIKKRVRRVGKTPPRKMIKLDETGGTTLTSPDGAAVAASTTTTLDAVPRVLSKHDEKWNGMFEKLVEFKNKHNTTLVPQCYDQDPRLGRWVHYQRVEYWIYQQTSNGKITPDRIARLEAMGFEWDPQRAQWNQMFKKLQQFKDEIGHCKVPKGYSKDPELANWVRNQRLEHANMTKGKRSRMTEDRYQKLDELGFKWSTTMPPKGSAKAKTATTDGDATVDNDSKTTEQGEAAKGGTPAVVATPAPKGSGETNEALAPGASTSAENGANANSAPPPSIDTTTTSTAPIAGAESISPAGAFERTVVEI